MEALIIGIVCAVASFACFAMGMAVGWNVRGSIEKAASRVGGSDVGETAEKVKQERRQDDMRRMNEAFEALQNYSVETAYGMGGGGNPFE